ncbi:MAG TPA: tRNA lysidine(34) synthetase TilS [Vicinamibacterales bacterium]|nr:tRNA lysidine(34) synthetase TilS [Vicinamibacterales bacterium]
MHALLTTVHRTIRQYGLIQPGTRVAVALSGGADSVALVHVLRELAENNRFHLVGVCHLNHRLRGADSDEDEAFCRALAARLSLPIEVESVDARALARDAAVSVEHAAHDAREAFFVRAAERLNAGAVAVAHTRNDQAETFLLRLVRGAGPRGLGGMHPKSGTVIRPFIEASREEVRNFLRDRGVEHREDASNADVGIPRNRIRHELIPFLEARFSPGIVEVLDREAAIARDDAEFLDAAAAAVARRVAVRHPDRVEIAIRPLLDEPPAVVRRVLRDAQRFASGGKFVGFEAAQAVLAFAVSNFTEPATPKRAKAGPAAPKLAKAGPLDLPGHRVHRLGETLVLTRRVGRSVARPADPHFCYGLDVPGAVNVPEAACAISAEPQAVPSGESVGATWPLVGRGDEVVVEGRDLARPLVVRSREAGDAFRPLGFRGRKTLQDFFVDAKVQREKRGRIPIVVDAEGRIIWVAGLSVSEDFRVTDRTKAVVILKRRPA